MAMPAKIPLVQFFFLDLMLAFSCRKGFEVACRTLDPSVFRVVIVAEHNRVGAGRIEGNVTAANDREGWKREETEHEGGAENSLHRSSVAPVTVLLDLHVKGFFSIMAFTAEITFIDAGHVHLV
jgi:hypothetical protein